MSDEIQHAIESADVEALRTRVAAEPALASAEVRCGEHGQHTIPALHLVCDAVFRRVVTQEQALAMANVLLGAGVDPELAYARSGDTFLIAAASLGAQRVGERLVEVGADVTPRGLFGATALHWAAFMGLDRLTRALIEQGAELELTDKRYDCTPLQWALHSWTEGTNGDRDGLPRVTAVLVEHGARVPDDALASLTKSSDAVMRAALASGARSTP